LEIAIGRVIGRYHPRHRAAEFRNFLAQVEHAMPVDLDIGLVLDNCATHKALPVKWLAHHPRYRVHFAPISASWPH
jgi:DDE superfamily endonuclease